MNIEAILYQALASEWGIEVRVADVQAFKQRFYATRRKRKMFQTLSLRTHPDEPEKLCWITKQARDEEAA